MAIYIIKRLLQTIIVLIGITIITFVLMNVVPGDPVKLMFEKRADEDTINRVRHELGLDKPLVEQYFTFLKNAVKGDLGRSYFRKEKVTDVLFTRFKSTAKLAAFSYLLAIVIGVPFGIIAAIKRGKPTDSFIMGAAIFGISAPSFWVAIFLQILFGITLKWLPISGFKGPSYYILPAFALGTRYMASIARITRTSMLDVIGQDYIRTAKAKGIDKFIVILRHALKNALIPIVTMAGLQLGGILTGSILIETVFNIHGIGMLTVEGMMQRDLPLLQGAVLYIAFIYVIINLVVDISYGFIDPRIRVAKEVN